MLTADLPHRVCTGKDASQATESHETVSLPCRTVAAVEVVQPTRREAIIAPNRATLVVLLLTREN